MTRVVPFIAPAADLTLLEEPAGLSAERASPGEPTKFIDCVRENMAIYLRAADSALAEADALLDGAGAAPSTAIMRRVAALDARHLAMREAAGRWAVAGLPFESAKIQAVAYIAPPAPMPAEELPTDPIAAAIVYQRMVRGGAA